MPVRNLSTNVSTVSPAHSGPDGPPNWGGHLRGTKEYRRLLAGLFFAGVATFAQLYSPQAVLPEVARDLGADAAESALLISAATIGLAIGVIPWSALADRIGRVRAMSIGVVGATVFGLIVPFAPTMSLLLVGRLCEGLMIGGVPAIAIAYLTEEISANHTTRAAGAYVAGTAIGGLSGRIIAGPIAEISNWRAGVFAVAAVCSIAAVLFIWLVPAPRGFTPRRMSRFDELVGLRQRLMANLGSPRQLALYAQGFLLMGGFVAVYNFLGFRLGAPPYSLSQTLLSLIFLAYLAGTWSSTQAGAFASRFGRMPLLLMSIAMMVVGVSLTFAESLLAILTGLVVITAGFFGAHAIASGWSSSEASIGRAQASSLYNLFYYAGSTLFGWLGGIYFASNGWNGTAVMVIILAVCSALIALSLLRGHRQPPSSDPDH